MADNYQALEPTAAPSGTQLITVRAPEIGGVKHTAALLFAADGSVLIGQQARAASLPTTLATEDLAALIAALGNIGGAVIVAGTVTATGPLTDGQLRATPVPVSGTVTASGAATETTLAALNTKIPASPATDRTTAAAPAAVRLSDGAAFYKPTTPTDTQPVAGSVGGYTRAGSGSMTRPADTTAYTAGDGVTTATSSASAMTVTGAARVNAGSGVIIGGRAAKSSTSTTNAAFRLWIYQDATGVAIPNDNAAFSPAVVADRLKLIGTATIDFSAVGIVGSDGVSGPISLSRSQIGFTCAGGSTSLLVIWQATAAYTPVSAETFHLILDILAD